MKDSTPQPRYTQIRQALEAEIMAGAWPPGHRIPSETDLAESYGCARMTVNKAIGALVEAGLIVRRRRAGSFVANPVTQEPVLEIADIEAEVRALGRAYGYRLVENQVRPASARDAARLGIAANRPVLALTCLHSAANRPFAHEDRLINLDAVPAAGDADFSAQPPTGWLLAQVPWTEAEHRIRALNAPGPLARRLAIEPGEACLNVDRITWRAGTPVTQVSFAYPAKGHELVARFNPVREAVKR